MTAQETIVRTLSEVWPTQGRAFATFEVGTGRALDPDRFVQYVDGELNVRWPLDEDPATALPRRGVALPRGSFVACWTPGQTAVIAVGDLRVDEVAALVDRLLARVLADGEAYDVTSRVEPYA